MREFRSAVAVVALMLCACAAGGIAYAEADIEPPHAAVEWVDLQQPAVLKAGQLPTGYLPNPFMPPSLALPAEDLLMKAEPLGPPPLGAFDSRPDRVTSVKNQGGYGTCWLFAAIGDLESKVKIDETPIPDPNYSEWDVIEGLAEGGGPDIGGNALQVCNHLSKYGAVDEAYNPYQSYPTYPSPQPIVNYWNPPAGTPLKNVTKWYQLGNRRSDATTIKNFVQNVGPVATAFSVSAVNTWATGGSGPGKAFNTYNWDSDWVVPYISATSTDHAILIVGWDDSKPWYGGGGTGAWLVKNSWGTSWGNGGNGSVDAGYFWIAYGSALMGVDSTVYPLDGWKDYDPNETIKLYDEFGCFGYYGWTGKYTVYLCSRMTPTFAGSRQITAVDVWVGAPNVSYEVRIYDNWNTAYPYTPLNQKGSTVTGTATYAGYYSIPMAAPIPITSGDEVCVHVKLTDTTNSDYFIIPVEADPGWFVNPISMQTNKSYVRSTTTNSWSATDLGNWGVGDLGVRLRYSIPVVVPAITNVTSPTPNGTYSIEDSVEIQVPFSQEVTVTGSPVLELETGSVDNTAAYTSGSGTNTLVFTYTVAAGDDTDDLDYRSTTALKLNGGTIRDSATGTVDANLTLPAPGAVGSLSANKNIVIDAIPRITVTSPTAGANWARGTVQSITWDSVGIPGNVRIYYSTTGSTSLSGGWIAVGWGTAYQGYDVANDGEHQWLVDAPVSDNVTILVRSMDETIPGLTNWWDSDGISGTFNVTENHIAVTSPTSASAWEQGTEQTITWNSDLAPSELIKLYYSTDGGGSWTPISYGAPNTGSFSWTVDAPVSSAAIIRAKSKTNAMVSDDSDVFSITPDSSVPPANPITLTPNPVEVSQTLTIGWPAAEVSDSLVKIYYSLNDGASWTAISYGAPNTGSYAWTVDAPVAAQVDTARIRVRSKSSYEDFSADSNAFTLLPDSTPPPANPVTLNPTPVTKGGVLTIGWPTAGISGQVKIYYSLDNGTTWTGITYGAPNTGSYAWTVNAGPSTTARIRVRSKASYTEFSADSEVFTITQ